MTPNAASKHDKQSLHYLLLSGFAGGIAGCVAKTVVAPLDRVKILFQSSNPDFNKYAGSYSGALQAGARIYREGGILGLFQGHSATLLRIYPYAAIKFMAYDQLENTLMPTPEKQTNLRRFVAGAASGVTSVLFTYPLEIIRVRMAYITRSVADGGSKPSFLHAAAQIYHETPHAPSSASTSLFHRLPLLKFYRGFSVTLTGMVPYAGTSFLTWGYLRARFIPPPPDGAPRRATPLLDLACGAASGALAQTASYPFEVVRRRMQVGGLTHPDRWMRWRETAALVYAARGWRGFYVGLGLGYLKIVPMTAVSYAVWQWIKLVLDQ